VDSWHNQRPAPDWKKVWALEETSRNSEATAFAHDEPVRLVHLQAPQLVR
jgi:hypothetical protein